MEEYELEEIGEIISKEVEEKIKPKPQRVPEVIKEIMYVGPVHMVSVKRYRFYNHKPIPVTKEVFELLKEDNRFRVVERIKE